MKGNQLKQAVVCVTTYYFSRTKVQFTQNIVPRDGSVS